MNIIKPKPLKAGDTLAVIAPAGNINRKEFLKGVEKLEELGFNVKFSEKIFFTAKNKRKSVTGDIIHHYGN